MTENPCSSIMNGYSFVPWAEPRYLTIRMRRVAICSATLWLRKITQSATYSSRPKRVRVRSPCSPVMTAVTPRVFRKPNRRLSSARRITSLVKPEKRVSTVSSTTRFAPMVSMAWPRRMKSPSRSYSPVSSISLRSMCT